MSTLYKRANARQRRILRIVEGAVHNALHGHPEITIPPNFARSVAKRAAGTLTAQWPEVLAIPSSGSSDMAEHVARTHSAGARGSLAGAPRSTADAPYDVSRPVGSHAYQGPQSEARVTSKSARASLRQVRRQLSLLAGERRHAGDEEGLGRVIVCLRLLAEVLR